MTDFAPGSAEWSALALSLKVACCCALVVSVPGTLCGWFLARKRFPGRTILLGVLHVPMVLPPVVIGYGLLLLLGRNGVLGGWLSERFGISFAFTWHAAVIAAAIVAFPLVVRSVCAAVELVDPGLEEAAATLGAGPLRRLATITLPLALPGVVAGTVMAFARSLGEFGATITFAGNLAGETRTLSLAVYTAMQTSRGEATVARLAVMSILLSLGALVASEVFARMARRSVQARRGWGAA